MIMIMIFVAIDNLDCCTRIIVQLILRMIKDLRKRKTSRLTDFGYMTLMHRTDEMQHS